MSGSRDDGAAAATARFFSEMAWAPQLQQASLQDVHDAQDRSGITSEAAYSRASTSASSPGSTWNRRTSSEHVNMPMQNGLLQHHDGLRAGPPSASSSYAASSRFYPDNQMVGLGSNTGLDLLGVPEMEDEEDGDDNDDEDDSKLDADHQRLSVSGDGGESSAGAGGHSKNDAVKKKAGGRPRDFIWRYYNDDMVDGKRAAICKFCANRQEMPKAFRMRQHIANCINASEDAKVMVRLEQERKDEDARVKKVVQMKQKNMALKAAGASTSFDNLAEPSGAGSSAQPQSLVFNPYGGLSTQALPMLPPANGHKNETPASEEESPEASTSKRKTSANPARKRKRAKKEDTLAHLLSSNIMSPQQAARSPVTCHVLDSTAGKPGSNVRIRLDQLGQTGFVHVANGETDADGRNGSLLTPGTAIAKNSIFKLTFYTKDYWTAKGVDSFYPFVEVVFEIKEPSEHHHIALMLSPFAYTTYRGS